MSITSKCLHLVLNFSQSTIFNSLLAISLKCIRNFNLHVSSSGIYLISSAQHMVIINVLC